MNRDYEKDDPNSPSPNDFVGFVYFLLAIVVLGALYFIFSPNHASNDQNYDSSEGYIDIPPTETPDTRPQVKHLTPDSDRFDLRKMLDKEAAANR